ncbi:hypothetical protein D3C84_821340 [compost metagenome]
MEEAINPATPIACSRAGPICLSISNDTPVPPTSKDEVWRMASIALAVDETVYRFTIARAGIQSIIHASNIRYLLINPMPNPPIVMRNAISGVMA